MFRYLKAIHKAFINTNKQVKAYNERIKELDIIITHANMITESMKELNKA